MFRHPVQWCYEVIFVSASSETKINISGLHSNTILNCNMLGKHGYITNKSKTNIYQFYLNILNIFELGIYSVKRIYNILFPTVFMGWGWQKVLRQLKRYHFWNSNFELIQNFLGKFYFYRYIKSLGLPDFTHKSWNS